MASVTDFGGGGRGRGGRNGAAGDGVCDRDDGVTGKSKWSAFKEEDINGTTSIGEI